MVLKGLQRTLRKMRSEWDMVFTGSGKEALNRFRYPAERKDDETLVVVKVQ